MNAPPQNKRKPIRAFLYLSLLTAVTLTPFASAGEGGADVGMVAGIAALAGLGGAAVVHMAGPKSKQTKTFTVLLAVAGLVGATVWGVTGLAGTDAAGGAPAASAAPAASLGGTSFAKAIDLTVVLRDFHTGAAVASADVYLYKNSSGYTLQQLHQRSIPSVISCTTDSAGSCSINAIPADVYDICASKAGYYAEFEACKFAEDLASVTLSALATDSTPGVTVTGIYLRQHGTPDLTKTGSTIGSSGCSAGTSTCPLTVFFGNDKADSILAFPAVKLTPKVTSSSATTNNLTFASLQSGATTCGYGVVNSVYYVYDTTADLLGAKQWKSCGLNLNYASSSTDGKIGLELNDGYIPRMYVSMASKPGGVPAGDFETNTNWPNVAAVTLDVTR